MNKNIAIIGSGFLGLTLALRLAEQGNQVTVFESASEIGGLAGAWQIGDVVWDKHYHVTLLLDSLRAKSLKKSLSRTMSNELTPALLLSQTKFSLT